MFKEQEPASRPQDVANPSNGVCHAGDRAQRERADDRIHAGLWQGDSLTRQTQEFHIQLRLASLPLGSLYHSWIGFQRVKFLHFRWIVVWEIHARSDADLQDRALRLWKKPLANLLNGLRIAEHRDNVRIDPVSVKGHGGRLPARRSKENSRRRLPAGL